MEPAHYLGSSYFEHWLDGIARVLAEKGVVTAEEMEARMAFFGARPDAPASAARHRAAVARRRARRTRRVTPRSGGDRAAALRAGRRGGDAQHPSRRATRGCPLRARQARRGRRAPRCHVFPDTNAHGLGEQPQHVYSVRFDARELWGEAAEPSQHVYLDLWESYLLPG